MAPTKEIDDAQRGIRGSLMEMDQLMTTFRNASGFRREVNAMLYIAEVPGDDVSDFDKLRWQVYSGPLL